MPCRHNQKASITQELQNHLCYTPVTLFIVFQEKMFLQQKTMCNGYRKNKKTIN